MEDFTKHSAMRNDGPPKKSLFYVHTKEPQQDNHRLFLVRRLFLLQKKLKHKSSFHRLVERGPPPLVISIPS